MTKWANLELSNFDDRKKTIITSSWAQTFSLYMVVKLSLITRDKT
jgi:hypothetical protein